MPEREMIRLDASAYSPTSRLVHDLHPHRTTPQDAVGGKGEWDAMWKSVFVGILLTAAASPAGARDGERLVLRVSPAISFAPANLVVRAEIGADPANRAIQISAESEDFYRSSEISLDGNRAPRTNQFEFRSLPPGTYEVTAVLLGSMGEQRASVTRQVDVMSVGGDR